MTDIIPWLIANWLPIAQIVAIALALLILLVVGISFAVSWYFWKYVIEIERDINIVPLSFGDSTHLPADYWEAVAREEAKRRAA